MTDGEGLVWHFLFLFSFFPPPFLGGIREMCMILHSVARQRERVRVRVRARTYVRVCLI